MGRDRVSGMRRAVAKAIRWWAQQLEQQADQQMLDAMSYRARGDDTHADAALGMRQLLSRWARRSRARAQRLDPQVDDAREGDDQTVVNVHGPGARPRPQQPQPPSPGVRVNVPPKRDTQPHSVPTFAPGIICGACGSQPPIVLRDERRRLSCPDCGAEVKAP